MLIDHVQLTVPRNLEGASIEFYTNVLGLERTPKPAPLASRGGAWYQLGPSQLHISVEDIEREANASSKRHVCFVVESLQVARRRVEAAGVEIIEDKQPIAGFVRFYLRDPGGNRLEIAEVVGS